MGQLVLPFDQAIDFRFTLQHPRPLVAETAVTVTRDESHVIKPIKWPGCLVNVTPGMLRQVGRMVAVERFRKRPLSAIVIVSCFGFRKCSGLSRKRLEMALADQGCLVTGLAEQIGEGDVMPIQRDTVLEYSVA